MDPCASLRCMGRHLVYHSHSFTLPKLTGNWNGFYKTVKNKAKAEVKVPSTSPFNFEYTVHAAKHNAKLLNNFDFNLDQLIDAHQGTMSSYGSKH